MLDADDEPRQEQESVGVGGKLEEGEEKREAKRRKQNKDQDTYSIKEINTNHKQKDEDRRKESGLTALKESGGKGWTVDMAPVVIKSVLPLSQLWFVIYTVWLGLELVWGGDGPNGRRRGEERGAARPKRLGSRMCTVWGINHAYVRLGTLSDSSQKQRSKLRLVSAAQSHDGQSRTWGVDRAEPRRRQQSTSVKADPTWRGRSGLWWGGGISMVTGAEVPETNKELEATGWMEAR
ncbi:predicted protein [Aspergillus nidulans FGSC A4]|uniref:Uncharacterized protein n=1 Tax=Emericella nidulans (strain FGSC A4 / ATCC 38163 / CBS 112.46 / NRRL 194 / M139) TaxID=227321 RepID=Q5BGR6_EMENI|nr:hypothetical protein [Aspergillus nidulans FGSC A4]EAA66137.1 predicted protein [Aspergillus nidulans FGSC A4]CBF89855.1 TPA: hypothetical protein ANIA_00264 [Aspergillus nidulans FGSC A4]|eukprot:XP_657868.1 predicted protein [Aspergillus nidulans FGSC A4]